MFSRASFLVEFEVHPVSVHHNGTKHFNLPSWTDFSEHCLNIDLHEGRRKPKQMNLGTCELIANAFLGGSKSVFSALAVAGAVILPALVMATQVSSAEPPLFCCSGFGLLCTEFGPGYRCWGHSRYGMACVSSDLCLPIHTLPQITDRCLLFVAKRESATSSYAR